MAIIIAAAVVAAIGLIIGIGLGVFGEKFKVEIDEEERKIREALPGNNCGGCGYPGCDGLAHAIHLRLAAANQCPVGGAQTAAEIGKITGLDFEKVRKTVAFVRCNGNCDAARNKSVYSGIRECTKATVVPGGAAKACTYGCWGFGSCEKVCKFDAIHVINGVAKVDPEKCTSCGKCFETCPNKLIALVPYDSKYHVACLSHDKGKDVTLKCTNGCIGCTLCTKQCEVGAIRMDNNLAYIDYTICVSCGKCAEKCPKKIIL